jgi:hypothetical protein
MIDKRVLAVADVIWIDSMIFAVGVAALVGWINRRATERGQ